RRDNWSLMEVALVDVRSGRSLLRAEGRGWATLDRPMAPGINQWYPVIWRRPQDPNWRWWPPTYAGAPNTLRVIAMNEAAKRLLMSSQGSFRRHLCGWGAVLLSVTAVGVTAPVGRSGWFTLPVVEAAMPAQLAQGFADIVKKVTPAVVNIAVTGGESTRRPGGPRRPPLPPGPFGGPPEGPPGEEPPGMEPPPLPG